MANVVINGTMFGVLLSLMQLVTLERDTALRDITLSIRKTDEHFIIKAGCKTLVVHDFKEAKIKLTQLFTKEYKSFFDEDNKST